MKQSPAKTPASTQRRINLSGNRVVIVEEGWGYAGFGGHISDFIHRELFDDLDAPVQRVHGLDVNMAYAENLERLIQPSVPRVIEAVNKVLYR
jgi:pyruvate dehydrogenase E1 component beta subunit